MSKLLLNYRVQGENKNVLLDRVLEKYRNFMGDSEAELPQNTVIQISPDEEVLADGSGESVLTIWEADVTISHPYNRN